MNINTKNDWWQELESNWINIERLINTFHPVHDNAPQMEITAPTAELARKFIASDIKEIGNYTKMKDEKDSALSLILSETYWGIPESTECWQYPGFGVLCDLCSESDVLFEEE